MKTRAFTLVIGLALFFIGQAMAQEDLKSGVQPLQGVIPQIEDRDPSITYDYDFSKEQFFVSFPKNNAGSPPCGVLVFMSAEDNFTGLPPGWDRVLEKERLILIAPQKVGNYQETARRAGLGIVSVYKLAHITAIDTNRVYVSGFSGGGRIASYMAFAHPHLFAGVVGICGVNFPGAVPRVKATRTDVYGLMTIDAARITETRTHVRFALVTGTADFRYGNILDIYEGGFLKDKYMVKLLDVPKMGHAVCSGEALAEALQFIQDRTPAK